MAFINIRKGEQKARVVDTSFDRVWKHLGWEKDTDTEQEPVQVKSYGQVIKEQTGHEAGEEPKQSSKSDDTPPDDAPTPPVKKAARTS